MVRFKEAKPTDEVETIGSIQGSIQQILEEHLHHAACALEKREAKLLAGFATARQETAQLQSAVRTAPHPIGVSAVRVLKHGSEATDQLVPPELPWRISQEPAAILATGGASVSLPGDPPVCAQSSTGSATSAWSCYVSDISDKKAKLISEQLLTVPELPVLVRGHRPSAGSESSGGGGQSNTRCVCGCPRPAESDAAFCSSCGVPLPQLNKCGCGFMLPAGAAFCPKCGLGARTSANMPASFSVLPGWRKDDVMQRKSSVCSRFVTRRLSVKGPHARPQKRLQRWLPLHPSCAVRVCWDLSLCLILLYESLMLPLTFIDIGQSGPLLYLGWATRIFWTLDIPLAFCTGFDIGNGEVELRMSKIGRRYMKALDGLALDAVLVITDWTLFFMTASFVGAARSVKILKAMRVLRVLRTVRILRVMQLSEKYMPGIRYFARSVAASVIVGITRVMVLLLIANHFLACCWCWIGEESRNVGNDSWLDVAPEGIGENYVVAFHWALTQFIGSMDVNPRNSPERVYAIGVLLLAFVVMSVVPPTITTLMTDIQSAATENAAPVRQLTHYLQDNNISQDLGVRVQRAGISVLRLERQRMPESRVTLLGLIPAALQAELKHEMFSPLLVLHPFFSHLKQAYPSVFLAVCHRAVSRFTVPREEPVFLRGEAPEAPGLLLLRSGLLSYRSPNRQDRLLAPGSWACEPALWTEWAHRGDLVAVEDSVLVIISTAELQEVLQQVREEMKQEPRRYAEDFVESLNDAGFHDVLDLVSEANVDVRGIALRTFPCLQHSWSLHSFF